MDIMKQGMVSTPVSHSGQDHHFVDIILKFLIMYIEQYFAYNIYLKIK